MRPRHSIAAVLATFVTLAVALIAGPGHADSPLPPPAKRTIFSANKQFVAVSEPDRRVTTVYRADGDAPGMKLWAMYGWFRVASLADDGEQLVAGYDGMNLLPLDYDRREVMIYFFRRGELLRYVTLDQLVGDPSKLIRTVSHHHWGNYVGFDKSGSYVVRTVDGRTFRFNATTGEALPAGR